MCLSLPITKTLLKITVKDYFFNDMDLRPKKEKERRKQQLVEGSNKFLGEKIKG